VQKNKPLCLHFDQSWHWKPCYCYIYWTLFSSHCLCYIHIDTTSSARGFYAGKGFNLLFATTHLNFDSVLCHLCIWAAHRHLFLSMTMERGRKPPPLIETSACGAAPFKVTQYALYSLSELNNIR
jgi:hypothetical protein